MFKEKRGDVQLPRIMGHKLSGEVVEIGSGVDRVKINDRVVLDPVFACGSCPTCKKGYPNVCSSVKCYGVQMDGGYRDYIVVEKHLHTFSPSISFETAALAEPFSIASNILKQVDLKANEKTLIIGFGIIGLSVLQVAKSFGAETLVTDISQKKLESAKLKKSHNRFGLFLPLVAYSYVSRIKQNCRPNKTLNKYHFSKYF